MIGALHGLHDDECDVGLVSAARLLVDRAAVEARVAVLVLNGVHVHHGHCRKEHFGLRFNQTRVSPVPRGAVQVQAVDVHALLFMKQAR